MPEYKEFVVCGECGWKGAAYHPGSGSLSIYHHGNFCPGCGHDKGFIDLNFTCHVFEWIPEEHEWWEFWKWGKGKWVELER